MIELDLLADHRLGFGNQAYPTLRGQLQDDPVRVVGVLSEMHCGPRGLSGALELRQVLVEVRGDRRLGRLHAVTKCAEVHFAHGAVTVGPPRLLKAGQIPAELGILDSPVEYRGKLG